MTSAGLKRKTCFARGVWSYIPSAVTPIQIYLYEVFIS
jgi:hypothetical protein